MRRVLKKDLTQVEKVLSENRGKPVFLIDCMWHCYRSFYSFADMNKDGVPTGHLFGMARLIQTIVQNYDAVVFICEDGVPVRRKALNEDYKANRTFTYSFRKDFTVIEKLIQDIPNVYMAYNDREEADDLMFSISRIKDYGNHFFIYSGDNDLLQAIDDTTLVCRKISMSGLETIGRESDYYKDKFKDLEPYQIPYYRAIIGDSSDNIKPVIPRFPRKLAYEFAKSCARDGSIPMYCGDTPTQQKKTLELSNSIVYGRNISLMKLEQHSVYLREKDYSPGVSVRIAEEYGLKGYANFVKYRYDV